MDLSKNELFTYIFLPVFSWRGLQCKQWWNSPHLQPFYPHPLRCCFKSWRWLCLHCFAHLRPYVLSVRQRGACLGRDIFNKGDGLVSQRGTPTLLEFFVLTCLLTDTYCRYLSHLRITYPELPAITLATVVINLPLLDYQGTQEISIKLLHIKTPRPHFSTQ